MTEKTPLTFKTRLKNAMPARLLKLAQDYLAQKRRREAEDLSQVFTRIYEKGLWGKSSDPDQKYFSGAGSRDPKIVGVYVDAVRKLLSSFEKKPSAVDLGCGDFFVGRQIAPLCAGYIACDVAAPVIDFNRTKYPDPNVQFRVLDLTKDDLPGGDIVFIRQVLQHLSNAQIGRALPRLASKYKYLVLTEHLPSDGAFVPNLDRLAGEGTRMDRRSGIVLTSAPFHLPVSEDVRLCEVPLGDDGIVRTTLYKLAAG